MTDGFFIGDVTLDPDGRHRLVMAIRCDADATASFILAMTLDATLMNAPLAQLPLDDGDDAFVINGNGVLQTPTRNLGNRFEMFPIALPLSGSVGTRVIKTIDPKGGSILLGIAPIAESPFSVVMIRQVSGIMDLWLIPRLRLIGFMIFSIALILACIIGGATYMVGRIHTADRHRVQALHQVEYANKLASIGRLASGVAHEINNPLAIINQKTGLIKDLFSMHPEWGGNPKLMGLVDDVLGSVRRCGAITRRLLDFARHMETSVEPVDLEAVIRQVLAFMEKEAERRHIAVSVTPLGTIPTFEADHGNLQQIFLNLINNAFAAMADGGRLAITIRPHGDRHVQVVVSDTGHGIPEDDLKRVFEPFFSTRQGHGGTGLGLSVTYCMISEMGGSITVDSQVNIGTRFTIHLPLTPPGATGGNACPLPLPQHPRGDAQPAEEKAT
jgi:two-component system NtrC family sensor kinase